MFAPVDVSVVELPKQIAVSVLVITGNKFTPIFIEEVAEHPFTSIPVTE